MKRIVLCADDYGQAPPVSQGILALAQKGRLSATTCLVNGKDWPESAQSLAPYLSQLDVGLHLNLTEGEALSTHYRKRYGPAFRPVGALLRKCFFGKLEARAIEAECHAQLDRFISCLGVLPQFLDGHQHVHQFPIVRDVVLGFYETRLRASRPYVRLVDDRPHFWGLKDAIKKGGIFLAGTRPFKRALRERQVPHNPTFAGIYSFSKLGQYRKRFQQFLQDVGEAGLIMCHPALIANGAGPIGRARKEEYDYFSGPQFLLDCKRQGAELVRQDKGFYCINNLL